MRKTVGLLLVCVMIICLLGGCGILSKETSSSDELNPVSSVTMDESQASNLKDKSPVQLYFINADGTKLMPETRYINIADTQKGSDVMATAIINELIKGPVSGSALKSSIPTGTKLASNVKISKDGIATVDFSKEFIDKHPGGKKQEQLTLYSVVNTLTELKDVKSVEFKINGKVQKEFKGNFVINIPYPRSEYLIGALPADNQSAEKDTKEKTDSKEQKNEKTTTDKSTDKSTDKANDKSTDKASDKSNDKSSDKSNTDKVNTDTKDTDKSDSKTNSDVETNIELLE